jgi:hypothetical protein
MAIPGPALGNKTGTLKIKELRNKYQQEPKEKFLPANFHDELLMTGQYRRMSWKRKWTPGHNSSSKLSFGQWPCSHPAGYG